MNNLIRPGKAGTLLLTAVAAGAFLSCLAAEASAQESRRRRSGQEAKPVELTQEQVANLTKIANERKLNVDDLAGRGQDLHAQRPP
jgi:hypothetical protein